MMYRLNNYFLEKEKIIKLLKTGVSVPKQGLIQAEQPLGADFDSEVLAISKSRKQALAVMTKGGYINKLWVIFHCNPRRLKAFLKSGEVKWSFDTKKVKYVSL